MMSSPPDYSLKNLFTNMAVLAYEHDCIGLRIWLCWVTNMAALGYEYDCIGLQIWLRRLTEPYP